MSDKTLTADEIEQIRANIGKLMAETMKMNAEAATMARERFWYPAAIAAGLMTAGGVFAKFFV